MSVYFYGCISMDGYLADKNHGLAWLYQTGSSEQTSYDKFYDMIDITVMGKRTFDAVAEQTIPALVYPDTENYIFTHQKNFSAEGFKVISGDVVEFIDNQEEGKKIWIVGGNQMLAPLLNEDRIDSLIIQIAPVLLGQGIPLFTQKEDLKRFSLEQVNRYGEFAELVYNKTI